MKEESKNKGDKNVKKPSSKERSDKYDEKVSFDGTFDELLELTLKPKKEKKEDK